MKLAQQLADRTLDKSELYKYRNEFCNNMELPTKASQVARSALVAKADDERDIEPPRKMIKRPDASPMVQLSFSHCVLSFCVLACVVSVGG